MWSLLSYVQRRLIPPNHFRRYQLFVDNRVIIKCVVLVYPTIGSTIDDRVLEHKTADNTKNIACFCGVQDEEVLINLLEQCIPWSEVETLVFYANTHRFSIIITNLLQHKNFVSDVGVNPHFQMEIDRPTLEETKRKGLRPLRSG